MKSNILITIVILMSVMAFLSFQTKTTKTQFFVIGHVYINPETRTCDSNFEVTIAGKKQYFSNRNDMLKWMNDNNYSAVSVSFNTYIKEGFEVYIFE